MPQIRCPVLGCGKRKDEWGGRKDGYPLPSLDAFTLLLSPNVTIDTNTRICTNCYNIHRRPNADLRGRTRITPLPPLNPLLGLLAAATSSPAQPSAAPSSPSFSTSPPPPLPLPPPPPPPLPPPSSAPCPLSDITNAPRRQRRHDTPLKRKRELAEAAAALDAAVHFSLSFALILLSCPHFSPSSLLIPFFYHLPPVVRRPHSAVSCSSAWEAPATWMQRKVSASCRAGASSRPCHLPPVIHCFKHGITLRSDRTYFCLRSLGHVGIGHSHQSLLLGRSRTPLRSRNTTRRGIVRDRSCSAALLLCSPASSAHAASQGSPRVPLPTSFHRRGSPRVIDSPLKTSHCSLVPPLRGSTPC